ncbi:MAG: CDP-alcohol phosphatidyltransferase family protein [Clostridia bacterium]|nr:CDP-alcohol phosphatidyltransferase family protein [Clostridia bacterium]
MLGYYNPSVILTYMSLISATLGMGYLFSGAENGLFASIICMMVSGVCDMFDGAVANRVDRSEEEKMFGIQIDALCDVVAFGALPALMAIKLGGAGVFSKVAAGLILLSSVIRLGFFNVQETMRDRDEKRKYYTGVPVTLIAILFPALLLLGRLLPLATGTWAAICLCVLAVLEVSPVKLKKPYGKAKLVLLFSGIAIFALLLIFGKGIGA